MFSLLRNKGRLNNSEHPGATPVRTHPFAPQARARRRLRLGLDEDLPRVDGDARVQPAHRPRLHGCRGGSRLGSRRRPPGLGVVVGRRGPHPMIRVRLEGQQGGGRLEAAAPGAAAAAASRGGRGVPDLTMIFDRIAFFGQLVQVEAEPYPARDEREDENGTEASERWVGHREGAECESVGG